MNYVMHFKDATTYWKSLSQPEKKVHISVWVVSALLINIPLLELRMGAFFGGDYTLQLSTLYGLPINMLIFYSVVASLQGFQSKSWLSIFKKQGVVFVVLCLIEILLDSLLFATFYQSLNAQWLIEIVVGSFLLNAMFIAIPAWVYGIIKAGQTPQDPTPITVPKVIIKDGAQEHILELNELYFVKSEGNYVVYQSRKGKIMVRDSLKSVDQKLPQVFVRCHKSYIVNTELIEKKTYTECFIGEYSVPIGRTYQQNI